MTTGKEIVESFNIDFNKVLAERIDSLILHGAVDVSDLEDIPTQKAMIADALNQQVALLTPPEWSSHYKKFRKIIKNLSRF